MGREIDAYLLADGGAAVREPGPGGARPPRGMAWQEGLRMAPEVRRRRRRRAALQQGRATQDLLARAPAATAGGAGPPAGAAPAGRRRCVPRSSSGAGPGRCAGAAAVLNFFDTSNHKLVAHNRVPITQIVHNLKWFDIYIIVY